ncbi:XRE family transcriptional regulator [Enterobacter sp. A11]|uniref:helix-turn-helix transcriptional regulator n=1 Tax=unclassified Enterobacter TaxID=2608935 RepID=UPI00106FD5AE|nr:MULTISPECIES: helix-turn-helix transcriptional regulator [unclassified Enterobacter]MBM1023155.1 helix-turn-helix transcriptional regulator [Enterobacter sp. E1]MEA3564477.1 helix-turn-helix transcriptional regulator [Enterobacter sp. GM-22]MEA3598151.1 helix-turn-helix transcriptional regulator [Enterobacter sp. GM-31]TFF55606.1 XRE family transcriptional regulator [Enterobacter sp. A11]
MSQNFVKQFRTQQSMTQRELAESVGTSQQQIQRIESGKIAAKLGIAQAICSILNKPLHSVFPEADKSLAAFRNKRYRGDEELESIAADGIEMDGCEWIVKLFLQGHAEPLFLPILPADKRRFYSYFYEEVQRDTEQFFVFDSESHRFALNIRNVVFHQFLFEAPGMYVDDANDDEDDYANVRITLTDGRGVIPMCVEADEAEDEETDYLGQLASAFSVLESNPAPGERLQITDADGEDAFVRVGSIAMLQASLDALYPVENDD